MAHHTIERARPAKSGAGPNRSMPIWGAAQTHTAGARHDDLMVAVVVIGAVVVHYDQKRDLVFCRHPTARRRRTSSRRRAGDRRPDRPLPLFASATPSEVPVL